MSRSIGFQLLLSMTVTVWSYYRKTVTSPAANSKGMLLSPSSNEDWTKVAAKKSDFQVQYRHVEGSGSVVTLTPVHDTQSACEIFSTDQIP
ncbi:hypothetical protein EDD18DRAFT_1176839 [Armillaria luteobubalina]|uniref:Uncharacterized protein n=1 Tax=Armillaria luteobubalina TaxID=153913 RepID=A0AA39Q0I8_9AGAR|nr:hypothetical protein EDD18DRAFT_1176839 [Armillaria luteobubalina]